MKRSKKEVLDADFAAARAGVLDVAAFLDRVDRGEGEADFRYRALLEVLPLLSVPGPGGARAGLARSPTRRTRPARCWKRFPAGMPP